MRCRWGWGWKVVSMKILSYNTRGLGGGGEKRVEVRRLV